MVKAEYQVGERIPNRADGGTGTVTLFINGEKVGEGKVGRTVSALFSLSETFDVGVDTGTPVSRDHTRTTGNDLRDHVEKVTIQITD